jgi:hypothetical protein
VPVPPVPTRPGTFTAGDFRALFAPGPEASAPVALRELVNHVKHATARAANDLEALLRKAADGTLTDADLAAAPPNARATVEAFLRTTPADANYHALYGSALQYLAEARLAEMFGGALPPGVAVRRGEVRAGRRLIPDVQIEITLTSELRFPGRNTVERAVVDWTTAGEAGKIAKYGGGTPPVTFAAEIIHHGPPRPPTPAPAPAAPAGP